MIVRKIEPILKNSKPSALTGRMREGGCILAALAPVLWLFAVSTESLAFFVLLSLALVLVAIVLGARTLGGAVKAQAVDMLYQLQRVRPPGLPIVRYMSSDAFKVFVHDVGLLCAMRAVDPAIVLEKNGLFTHFKGALAEQFVLQELKTLGIESGYWAPDEGVSEVDFVVQGAKGVYPVEVKAATNTKAKSLGVYMAAYKPPFAVKTSLKNFSTSRDVRSLPLYAFGRWIGRWI